MSTVDVTLINRMNENLEALVDLFGPSQELSRVDFLHSLLTEDDRSAPGLRSILDHLSRQHRTHVDSEMSSENSIADIRTLEPKTVLVLDPHGLRDSYASWASLYRESLTVICRDSWQNADLLQSKNPIVAHETAHILSRDDTDGNRSLYEGCFDLVLGFHEGATNLSKDVLPLLSPRGMYLEIFIDNFHANEISTIYNRNELEAVVGHS